MWDDPGRRCVRSTGWLIGLLIAVRLAYLGQYLKLPFLFGPLFDSQVYLAQAEAVRAGRFADPTLLAFSPLYGYFLAALRARPGALVPILLQLGLGIANVLLVRGLAARCFGERAGLWAAVAWSLYGPLLFFETKLMSETLGLTLLLVAVDRFASEEFARGRRRAVVVCGVALALAVLARASLLPSLPCFVLVALLRQPAGAPFGSSATALRLRRALGLGLVLVAVHGGYGAFTRLHSGIFVPVIMVSNTVAQTTQGEWSGELSGLQPDKPVGAFSVVEQAERRLRAVQRGEPDPAAARGTLQGVDPLGWLRQLPAKALLTLRDLETSFDYGFYGERSEVPLLYLTFATFGMLVCLANIGVWVAARNGSAGALLALLPIVLGVFLTTTLFHPSTRYRLPLLIAFAPLTGLTLMHAEQAFRAGKRRLPAALALLVLAFAARGATRGLDHPGLWELRVAESAAMAGDLPECRARIESALRREPGVEAVQRRARYVAGLQAACAPTSGLDDP